MKPPDRRTIGGRVRHRGIRGAAARTICGLGLAAAVVLSAGCSVYMAAHQPGKKDLSLLSKGTPRPVLLTEFGKPADTRIVDGHREDFFLFRQGYSKGVRTTRAIFHGTADVLTLGLWEIVGTPTEATFDGTRMAVDVKYDEHDRVERVTYLRHKGGAR